MIIEVEEDREIEVRIIDALENLTEISETSQAQDPGAPHVSRDC